MAALDDALVDLVGRARLDPAVVPWLATVRAAFTRAGAALCALHVESWQTVEVAAALVVAVQPFQGEHGVALAGLRALTLARTSAAGRVSVLELPAGPAVGSVDVAKLDHPRDGVAGPDPVPAQVGIVEVQLPVPAAGCLLSLTLGTPRTDLLGSYAGLAAGIAYRLRIEPGGPRRLRRQLPAGVGGWSARRWWWLRSWGPERFMLFLLALILIFVPSRLW